MAARKTAVFVAGDITFNSLIYLDSFPDPRPQTVFSTGFNETVGGTAAGKALNLNRLGFRESLILIADIDPKGTQRHVNLMAQDGGRISIYVRYATFDPEIDMDRLEQQIAQSDRVVLKLSNYCRRLIPLAKQSRKPVWCDIHDYDGKNDYHRDFIAGADVITMSSDALPDYKPFLQSLIAGGKQLVVCTHGRDGAAALTPAGEWITVRALPDYEQRDTNGAGDSFFAGLLYGYIHGCAMERCLRLGAIVAGLCVTSHELFYPDLSVDRVEATYTRLFGGDDTYKKQA
jgi:sugar/nucleoside kinase (ribokinase family)